ncbi:MAG: hypothetical protein J5981_04490 [Lachnospira sp.]|nr:hypothetical protein [Lachnospira sp.]
MSEIRYYKTFSDDFVQSKNQEYKLSYNYKWVHTNPVYRCISSFIYVLALFISFFYCRFGLHVKIKNRKILRKFKDCGCFLFGNHTQPVGDVFIPAHVCKSKRIFTVISPANFGIPVIGKLLTMLGGLPIPNKLSQMREFLTAISQRIDEKRCVVVYPEAHVWPYYTGIRPFPETAFKFPVENNAVSFCMTATYQNRKFGKKPGITVYLDGPFYLDRALPKKAQQKKLHDDIYMCMRERSRNSTYEYIRYERNEN